MERLLREKLPSGSFANVSKTRSRTMSKIRGKNAKSTERTLQMALVRARICGWRRHADELPGKPDFYFPEVRLAVFVDGCFWHGCPQCGHVPKTNTEFWASKLQRNVLRDRMNRQRLRQHGIGSIRIWEHAMRTPEMLDRTVRRLLSAISSRTR
jgi:DNA mismatch endonuclease (patch repair protein)